MDTMRIGGPKTLSVQNVVVKTAEHLESRCTNELHCVKNVEFGTKKKKYYV